METLCGLTEFIRQNLQDILVISFLKNVTRSMVCMLKPEFMQACVNNEIEHPFSSSARYGGGEMGHPLRVESVSSALRAADIGRELAEQPEACHAG